MMNSNLQKTIFSVEKIRNVVNVGNCSAYQICTIPGEEIGYLGHLELHTAKNAANEVNYIQESPRVVTLRKRFTRLSKTLRA
jgi:hypothetical protein